MTLADIDSKVIPAALGILNARITPEVRVLMLAIGLQESGFVHRAQVIAGGGKGPARGFWQFERGGVRGVYLHRVSHEFLRLLCRARDVNFDVPQIWLALETDDVLAAGVARLLLLTEPAPLPSTLDRDGAWAYYERLWRPGKPRPSAWPGNHATALAQVMQ